MIEPQSKAAVQPKMGGEVLEVYFQAGDRVEAGQALVKIDSDALTALKLQMDAAEVSVRDAASNLTRTRALYTQGYVSEQTMEQAENADQNARIAYETARNQYDLQLEYTTVTAPISGTVESRSVEPHDHVDTSAQICVISAGDQLQVKFGITEKIHQTLSLDDVISIEKNGTAYEGVVAEIGTMVNSATGLYDAKASIPQSAGLTTGTRVKLTAVMSRAENVLTVPVDAVNYDKGEAFVYCYEGGTARKTMIESGIYDSNTMEVKSGLTEESMVITSWSNELMDGAEVIHDGNTDADSMEDDSVQNGGMEETAHRMGR
ncbi:MAG: efflux RND transporter periplasmic adaptor subunit [Enterocloster clostridioformis]